MKTTNAINPNNNEQTYQMNLNKPTATTSTNKQENINLIQNKNSS